MNTDKYIIILRKDFKNNIISKRREFMDLLIKVLSDNDEATKEIHDKFGVKFATKYHNGNSVTILSDGEVEYKER
jgi:hypothetical protein